MLAATSALAATGFVPPRFIDGPRQDLTRWARRRNAHYKQWATQVGGAAAADRPNAEVIIAAAGMSLKKSSGHAKPAFRVTPGRVTGSMRLYAKAAGPRAHYRWQYSPDGKRWFDVPDTMEAETVITGLTPGKLYRFRFRTLTKGVRSGWSQVLSLMVV